MKGAGSCTTHCAGEIDRKKLGSIVFEDPTRLQMLNKIVWPEIWSLCEEELRRGAAESSRVVVVPLEVDIEGLVVRSERRKLHDGCIGVVEAAVLLQAGWGERLDAVWGTVVPPEIALERLQERVPDLSRTDAERRLKAGVSLERVREAAGAVFDTSGTKASTRRKIAAAWVALLDSLE